MKPLKKKKKFIAWFVGTEGAYISKAHQRRDIRNINKQMNYYEGKRRPTKRQLRLCRRNGHIMSAMTLACTRCGKTKLQILSTYKILLNKYEIPK